ncbi:MAG: uroporphyrinogen decarboxylase family protein [Spirochaetales bacterium]
MNSRDRFFAVLEGNEADRIPAIPISMMVASDLIGSSYKHYATDFATQVRGQIAFAEKFGFDQVSAISDPATEAADCGAVVVYKENEPPALDEADSLLKEKSVLARLSPPDPRNGNRMSNRLRVIEELRAQIGSERIVEGWIEGPVAEASDLRGINRFMMDFYDDEPFVRDLFEFIYEMELRYAEAQIEAGADVIGIGDAACSLIGGALYAEYVLEQHKRLIDGVQAKGALVRLHICGDSSFVLPHLPALKPDIMDLDSKVTVAHAREQAGPDQVLTGNIDPVNVLKNRSALEVEDAVLECYREAGAASYMIAAGCEIPRGTPDENIAALARAAERAP